MDHVRRPLPSASRLQRLTVATHLLNDSRPLLTSDGQMPVVPSGKPMVTDGADAS